MDPNNQNQPTEPTGFQPTVPVETPETVQQTPGQTIAADPALKVPVSEKDGGHTLGIVSLVLSVLGIGLAGVILGIMAINKSKKSGHGTNILGLVGIIWGAISLIFVPILLLLVIGNFQGAQDKGRDASSKTRLNAVYSKLEEFHNNTGYYPGDMTVTNFPGIEPSALRSGGEKDIVVITGSNSVSEAQSQRDTSSSEPYQYIPFGCTGDKCNGYVLRVHLDSPTSFTPTPYTKYGLQNP